jgi:hypothetical protein
VNEATTAPLASNGQSFNVCVYAQSCCAEVLTPRGGAVRHAERLHGNSDSLASFIQSDLRDLAL